MGLYTHKSPRHGNLPLGAVSTIYNSDGSETGACGNGTRCVADYLMKTEDYDIELVGAKSA